MRKRDFTISNLMCPVCRKRFPIARKSGQSREKGHIKTLWCPFCKEMQDMIEIREFDFEEEIEAEEEQRKALDPDDYDF